MNSRFGLIIFSIVILCLVSCEKAPVPNPTFSPTPSTTSSLTPQNTVTLTASITATIRPIASQTPGPLNIPAPTETASLTETATPPGMKLLKEAMIVNVSPDGNWLWGVSGYGQLEEGKRLQYSKTFFASKDGKLFWAVWPQTKDVGDIEAYQTSYRPIFWLPSEPYVYLAGTFCCADGPFGSPQMNLARLNLKTGQFSVQIPGWKSHRFDFSKSGKYLSDTGYKVPSLRFIRLSDWKITDIPLNPVFIYSDIEVFTPDENSAVVNACQPLSPDGFECYKESLLLFDILGENYRLLLPDIIQAIGIPYDEFHNQSYSLGYSWIDDNKLSITVWKRPKISVHSYSLNIQTNQLQMLK